MKRFFLLLVTIIGLTLVCNRSTTKADSIDYIYVDLKGAVEYPGVYRVSDQTRLFQLIEMAGGLRNDSYTRNINLSVHLEDELVIYIPFIGEGEVISENGLININTASLEVLDSLPSIGSVTASNIIEYRSKNGYFQSIEDIMKVSGIGQAIFDQIKEFITV